MGDMLRWRRVWLTSLLMGAVIVAVLGTNEMAWLGDPLWGQEVIGRAQLLILPLVSGAAAWWGTRDGSGLLGLLTTPVERSRHVLTVTGAQLLWLSGVYGLGHLVVVVGSRWSPLHFANGSFWPLLSQVLGAAVAFAAGYAVGVWLGSYVAVVVAAALWPLVIIGEKSGLIRGAVSELGASGTMLGYAPDPWRFGTRGVWLLLVALLALGTVAFVRGRAWIGLVTAVTFVAGGLVVPGGDGFRPVAEAQACSGGPVTVCGPSALGGRLAQGSVLVNGAAEVLNDLGATPPQQYVAWTAQADLAHENWIRLHEAGLIRAPLPVRDLVSDAVAPRSCSVWYADEPPPPGWSEGAEALAGYVATQRGLGWSTPAFDHLRASFAASGESGLRDSMRAVAAAITRCDPALIPSTFLATGP